MDSLNNVRSVAEVVMAERFGVEVRHAQYELPKEA